MTATPFEEGRPARVQTRAQTKEVKVWDPLVRIFHWSLVASYAVAWLTAGEWDAAHETVGYVIIGLIGFRLIWGVIGPRYARFTNFIYRPSRVRRYLRETLEHRARRHLGHNPAGGAMIIALLLSLGAVTGTGLMMESDAYWGVRWVKEVHEIAANLTLFLVALHVAGVIHASISHGENLARAMITGRKRPLDE